MLGSGTETDPYQITTVSELQDMQNDLSAYYILMNDIDASDTINWNNGAGFEPIPDFSGIFNGNGYSISNLYIYRPTENNVGLFSVIENDGVVKKLNIVNCDITGVQRVGGLCGQMFTSLVEQCTVTGAVTSVPDGTQEGFLTGGIVGLMNGSSFLTNYYPKLRNCYADVSVTGENIVGGLVGRNENEITNCYSLGTVSGNAGEFGGLVGSNFGTIENSYWNTETSGQSTSGGGSGRTTAEMTTYPYDLSDVYTNWNFTDIWGYNDRNSLYPVLQVFQESNCQVYNGSSWEDKPFIVYLGSPTNDWIRMYPYGYNGTSWI